MLTALLHDLFITHVNVTQHAQTYTPELQSLTTIFPILYL